MKYLQPFDKYQVISEALEYHINNGHSLFESAFRVGSDAWLALVNEARELHSKLIIELNENDAWLITTDVGQKGIYEGKEVLLDLPFVEEELNEDSQGSQMGKFGKYNLPKFMLKNGIASIVDENSEEIDEGKGDIFIGKPINLVRTLEHKYHPKMEEINGIIEKIDETSHHKPILVVKYAKDNGQGHYRANLLYSSFYKPEGEFVEAESSWHYVFTAADDRSQRLLDLFVANYFESDDSEMNEAEYKGKKVKVGYPMRGGTKKYHVYVKNPKTGKIKKLAFGDVHGGQTAKVSNPKARASFAARHQCAKKKDRMSAGYWACRINRYAHIFGKSYPGYW